MVKPNIPIGSSEHEESLAVGFSILDKATGRVLRSGFMPKFQARYQVLNANTEELFWEQLSISDVYVVDHVPIKMAEQPSEYHDFDWGKKRWVVAEAAKPRIWAFVKEEREQRSEYGGVRLAGEWFSSDTLSRSKYHDIVVANATVPGWRTMDNTVVELTQAMARQIVRLIVDNDAALFAAAADYRTKMEATENPTLKLASINWPQAHKSFRYNKAASEQELRQKVKV